MIPKISQYERRNTSNIINLFLNVISRSISFSLKWLAIHVTQHILSICEADKGRELLQTYLDDPAITRMYKELLKKNYL